MTYFNFDFLTIWAAIAQVIFFLSFVVQTYKSEKSKQSHLPIEFWILRIIASIMLVYYFILRQDIVFTISMIFQLVLYFRNIQLMKLEDTKL